MVVKAAYTCNVGKKRQINQDNLFFAGLGLPLVHVNDKSLFNKNYPTDSGVCFAVFDGAGGAQFGERASYLATTRMQQTSFATDEDQDEVCALKCFCYKANEDVLDEKKNSKLSSIASTACIVYLKDDTAWCCNLGDSKIYLYRNGQLSQISYDHVAQKAFGTGKKPPITQFLGLDIEVGHLEPFIAKVELQKDDIWIVSSDGLSDMVDMVTIKDVLDHVKNPVRLNRILLRKALKNGGRDNISIITIGVKD